MNAWENFSIKDTEGGPNMIHIMSQLDTWKSIEEDIEGHSVNGVLRQYRDFVIAALIDLQWTPSDKCLVLQKHGLSKEALGVITSLHLVNQKISSIQGQN